VTGGGGVVAGQLLDLVKIAERIGLAERVTGVAVNGQGLLVAGGGGRVITGQLPRQAQIVQGVPLAEPVPDVAEDRQRLLLAGGGGRGNRWPIVARCLDC